MRINYTDDEDFPGQFGLWQGNCHRSLRSKAGQAALRELEAALVALPDKALASGVFVETTGEVCALGALAVHRKVQAGVSREEAIAACEHLDPEESQEHGEALGFPKLAAWKVVEQNDIQNDFDYVTAEGPLEYPHGYHGGGFSIRVEVTPEQRYRNVLAWVRSQLVA